MVLEQLLVEMEPVLVLVDKVLALELAGMALVLELADMVLEPELAGMVLELAVDKDLRPVELGRFSKLVEN